MLLLAHSREAVQVRLMAVSILEHFTLEVETHFHSYLPYFEVGSLSNETLYSLRMCYKQCKLD
jgi:hypothetical protein